MAERGDVYRLKRRLGFGAKGEAEAVVIVQATPLNGALPTIVVAPLDPAVGAHVNDPAAVRVPHREAGSHVDQVAVPWRIRAMAADALAPGPVGRLAPGTLAAFDHVLKLVLGLG